MSAAVLPKMMAPENIPMYNQVATNGLEVKTQREHVKMMVPQPVKVFEPMTGHTFQPEKKSI